MYWENLVFDAAMPHEQGKYWEELLDTETFTDNEGGLETRLQFSGGRYLDLCFPTVSDPEPASQRVFPVLASSGCIASSDAGKKNPPREERNDIAGRQYFVLNGSAERARPLNLFAVELRSANPERDAQFWANLTGFRTDSQDPTVLVHPSGTGALIRLVPEMQPKTAAKSSVHLDLRLEPGDDTKQIVEMVQEQGGTELDHKWGEVPWRVFLDPSGNEFCILPAPAANSQP